MVDDAASAPSVCPWCSAALPPDAGPACPSCGATLRSDSEPQLPGVTAIDAEAIVRAARAPTPQRRNRLLSWISGDYDEEPASPESAPGSLAPPPPEVRREMLRLELEAEVANLQAEAESMMADAEVEARAEAVDADGEASDADAVTAEADEQMAESSASSEAVPPEATTATRVDAGATATADAAGESTPEGR